VLRAVQQVIAGSFLIFVLAVVSVVVVVVN
jgi:hypothetical protein